jgi:diphosphomevalonate decarboxylase
MDDIVRLARLGSGSACRSILGGFVHWTAGRNNDDSTCKSITSAEHWPNLKVVVIVTNDAKKAVGSTGGMKSTVQTSTLLKTRVEQIVPERVKSLAQAIMRKDFPTLATIVMQESNQLHALCLDTFPPLHYLNDESFRLIDFVHRFNKHNGISMAYTFDAGPNCFLFMEEATLSTFFSTFERYFTFSKELLSPFKRYLTNMAATDGIITGDPFSLDIKSIHLSSIGKGPSVRNNKK